VIVLGIDSAPAKTGWALVERKGSKEALLASGVLGNVDAKVVREFAGAINSGTQRPELVAIEDVYYDDEKIKDIRVVKVLSRLVGRWLQEFDTAGFESRLVMASVWQRGVLQGLITQVSKRADRKKAAKMFVRATYGATCGEDEADAIAMATWVARTSTFATRIARGE
jgi:Holliday junction resolvasome RuvABC endonuclease subunit